MQKKSLFLYSLGSATLMLAYCNYPYLNFIKTDLIEAPTLSHHARYGESQAASSELTTTEVVDLDDAVTQQIFPDIKLIALFDTTDNESASAVILSAEHGAYRYKAGDYITESVILEEILVDRIIIGIGAGRKTVPLVPLGGLDKHMELITKPDDLSDEDSQSFDTMPPILKHIDLTPVTALQADGYIVGDGFPKEATMRTGVKPGDIIVSVNGYPVGENQSDYLAWTSFQEGQKATIVVKRDENEFSVYYP